MSNVPPPPPGFVLDDVPAASAATPAPPPGFELLEDEGTPNDQFGGLAMNATAGANSALYTVAGAPVDAMRGAMNIGIRGINAATGAEIEQFPDDSFGGSRWIGETLGAIRPEFDPENTLATTTEERIARATGEGAGYAVAPMAALGLASRAGAVAPQIEAAATRILGGSGSVGEVAANTVIGAGSGAGAQAAMEATPDAYDPLAGLAGGIAGGGTLALAGGIPGLARTGARALGDYLAPTTQAGRERMAADRLRAGATDVQAARDTLDAMPAPLVPGSVPTTGQITGDMGLLGLERGSAVKRPEFYAQRRADQNAARLGALDAVQQGGAPEKVADAFRARLQSIDDEGASAIQAAQERARTSAGTLGLGMTPDAAGARLRGDLEAARSAAKAKERELWNLVDPDGSLALRAGNTRVVAREILRALPKAAKPIEGEEAAILNAMSDFGETVPFSELRAVQGRLTDAMRAERAANGESAAYRRMSQANNAIHQDLDRVVTGRVLQEELAVRTGRMDHDQTLLANLQREQQNWFDGRRQAAGLEVGGDSPVGYGSGRSSSVPGVRGAAGQSPRGFGGASGNTGVPEQPVEPNFDDAALGRLNAAKDATRARAGTFDNPTLAPLRARPTATGAYDLPASVVPARLFHTGTRSFDAIQQARAAIGDERLFPALQDYAVDRARRAALNDDGTFDPARLEAFRRSHADALRAVPGLSERFADAASASQALGEATRRHQRTLAESRKGSLARLMDIDTPQDVTRTVGSIFGAQDGLLRMGRLRSTIAGDAEAQQGLRQAVVDHMRLQLVGNTEAGTSGLGTIKADQFQTFVRRNAATLRAAGFSDDEVQLMGRIGEDIQRANRSVSAVKNPGDSNSAEKLYAAGRGDRPTLLGRILTNVPPAVGGVGGFVAGGPLAAVAGAVGAKTVADMRLAGLETVEDIVADALLNPGRARILLAKPTTAASERGTLEMLGKLYRRSAAVSGAMATGGNVAMMDGAQEPRRQPLEITVGRIAP